MLLGSLADDYCRRHLRHSCLRPIGNTKLATPGFTKSDTRSFYLDYDMRCVFFSSCLTASQKSNGFLD